MTTQTHPTSRVTDAYLDAVEKYKDAVVELLKQLGGEVLSGDADRLITEVEGAFDTLDREEGTIDA